MPRRAPPVADLVLVRRRSTHPDPSKNSHTMNALVGILVLLVKLLVISLLICGLYRAVRYRKPLSGILIIVGLLFFVAAFNSAHSVAFQLGIDSSTTWFVLLGFISLIAAGYFSFATPGASNTKPLPPSPIESTVQDRLQQLNDLRDQNVITSEEYEQRRKQILASI